MIHIRSKLAALLVIGGAAVVSAQQPVQGQQKVAGQHQAHAGRQGPGKGMARGMFRGITLSDAEKANIKAVHTKYATQTKALRDQFKPQHEALRDARKRGDTAAVKALWEKSAVEREQTKRLFDAQRADLRAALAPANQTAFDANVAKMQKHVAKNVGKGLKAGRRPGFRAPGA